MRRREKKSETGFHAAEHPAKEIKLPFICMQDGISKLLPGQRNGIKQEAVR